MPGVTEMQLTLGLTPLCRRDLLTECFSFTVITLACSVVLFVLVI